VEVRSARWVILRTFGRNICRMDRYAVVYEDGRRASVEAEDSVDALAEAQRDGSVRAVEKKL
jgi:RNase H-fold protein (predicted Holliday junction resolvase)